MKDVWNDFLVRILLIQDVGGVSISNTEKDEGHSGVNTFLVLSLHYATVVKVVVGFVLMRNIPCLLNWLSVITLWLLFMPITFSNIINNATIGPNGTYFICGSYAYSWLPKLWRGSCYLGYVVPHVRYSVNSPFSHRDKHVITETEILCDCFSLLWYF